MLVIDKIQDLMYMRLERPANMASYDLITL